MKNIIVAIFVLVFSLSSYSAFKCKYDWLGNYVCDHDNGYQTKTKKDWLGNDVTKDRYGSTIMSCKYDWLGNYVCK